MTEQDTAVSTPVTVKSKKAATPKAKTMNKKKVPASHPPTSAMVNAAIKSLKERGGSSLQAIKKYISSTYKVDSEKVAPFIKKYLKSAVDSGTLIRTKGKGASGSFKLAVGKPEGIKKPVTKKSKAVTKTSKPKKEKTPKKTKPKASKPKQAATKKSPSKVKKVAKTPVAKKTKTSKPKKKVTPKKAAKKPVSKK